MEPIIIAIIIVTILIIANVLLYTTDIFDRFLKKPKYDSGEIEPHISLQTNLNHRDVPAEILPDYMSAQLTPASTVTDYTFADYDHRVCNRNFARNMDKIHKRNATLTDGYN